MCEEAGQSPPVERVDHLSGRMQRFWFCIRHSPPKGVLERCVNARQLGMAWIDAVHQAPSRRR